MALAAVAQWIECQPVNQRVASLIPSQGMCLVCGPGPWLGTCKRQLIDFLHTNAFSPCLSPSLPLSKDKYMKKIHKNYVLGFIILKL